MPDTRHYYIHNDNKIVLHTAEKRDPLPEGYEYCGMSQLPLKGAAGYYTKGQQGFKIVNGDEESEKPNEPIAETQSNPI